MTKETWWTVPRHFHRGVENGKDTTTLDWDCGCGRGPHRYYLSKCPSQECRVARKDAPAQLLLEGGEVPHIPTPAKPVRRRKP